ncbi:MAG TPA: metalloregulator ArsR/SmtB family transcription factor [Solirubrobacteraceae bacterium]|nr:metalloregulator ArsR/SmtB family transcription factor [Solirubrobacteraceae bacterium]
MAAYRAETDDVFRALADPGRRRLLDSLNARGGQTLRELCADMEMARQSVSKHLAVLEGAQLVSTVWRGREKLHYLNPAPINEISERWIDQYDRDRVRALSDLKRALEDHPMDKPSFVYTTYIRTTPERLWLALTDPAFTERYWGLALESDWTTGSTFAVHQWGVTMADPEQVILESEPYRRLSYTWHTFTPEWREVVRERIGFPEEFLERVAAEPRSRVTFEIEELGELVKLTVVHDGFEPGSAVLATISQGWPHILSNLKTLLETGETLPPPAAPAAGSASGSRA